MEPLNILLLGVMVVEAIILFILLQLVKHKYPKKTGKKGLVKEKKTIKQRINGLKHLRAEQYIIFSVYVFLFATAGYFFIANAFPNNPINISGDYSLEASDLSMTSKLRSLYLDKDYVLGGKTELYNQTVRLIISEEPFNVVFNPKKVVAENTPATIELFFINPKTEVYFNDKLIIPDLDGYSKVQDFLEGGTEVWVKENLVLDSYVEGEGAENFIYENFPGNTIYSFAELNGGTPIIQDYSKDETEIDTQFRDNLKLAVYAGGSLDIEFTKQDINALVGKDEYTVEIKDFQGNEYFKKVYEDDGEKKNTGVSDEEQDFDIELNNLPRNIYYVAFTKDKYNPSSDSTIKDIRINSNKVLIIGTSLPWSEFNFYTKVNSPKKIGFKYWWTGKEQKIYQTGIVKDTINLDEDWLNEKYEQELNEKGDYNFEIRTGYLWVYSDIISPSKENWFYLPQKAEDKLIDSDIIIIDKDKLQINGDEVVYTESVEVSEDSKFKIQVLDKLQTYFKEIKLILEGQNEEANGLRLL